MVPFWKFTPTIFQGFKITRGRNGRTVVRDNAKLQTSSHLTTHSTPGTKPRNKSNQHKYLLTLGDSLDKNEQLKCLGFL